MSAPSSPRVTHPADHLDRAVPTGLDAIFRPRSVAVIGASRRPGSIGAAIFRNLLKQGFEGPVYPVNPQASVVQSVLAWPTVNDIPGDVDLAVIAVPSKQVLAAVEDCGRKGVRGIVVVTLNSFINPVHERRIGELIREQYPECFLGHLPVYLSHEISPKAGEYRRSMTVVIDAY